MSVLSVTVVIALFLNGGDSTLLRSSASVLSQTSNRTENHTSRNRRDNVRDKQVQKRFFNDEGGWNPMVELVSLEMFMAMIDMILFLTF